MIWEPISLENVSDFLFVKGEPNFSAIDLRCPVKESLDKAQFEGEGYKTSKIGKQPCVRWLSVSSNFK